MSYYKKEYTDCVLDTILFLALLGMVGMVIFALILVPIALLIVVAVLVAVFGLAGICYYWNNRGRDDSTDY